MLVGLLVDHTIIHIYKDKTDFQTNSLKQNVLCTTKNNKYCIKLVPGKKKKKDLTDNHLADIIKIVIKAL